MRVVCLNGEFVPVEEAKVSIFDRGFVFGDGVYEVTPVLDGRLVDTEGHMARLERSLKEIRLTPAIGPDRIPALMKELVARNGMEEGLVYLQITRGPAERDFPFPAEPKPTLAMFTQERAVEDIPQARTGIDVVTVPEIRWARRDIKSISLIGQVLAKQMARDAGAHEAWFVEDGEVTEGGSSNAYIVTRAGEIVTRVADRSILAGVTRKAILALAAETGARVLERPFSVKEAKAAAEAFSTNSSNLVLAVVRIDGEPVGDGKPGPVYRRLRDIYLRYARGA